MSYRRAARGSTIFELTAVLAVFAFVYGAAVPHLQKLLLAARLRGEAVLLQHAVQDLSLVAQQRRQSIVLAVVSDSYRALRDSAGGAQVLQRNFPHGISVKRAADLLLSPSGVVTPATIIVQSIYEACTITIALRGRTELSCI